MAVTGGPSGNGRTEGPPDHVVLDLEEAERLFAALEDAAAVLDRLIAQRTLVVYEIIADRWLDSSTNWGSSP